MIFQNRGNIFWSHNTYPLECKTGLKNISNLFISVSDAASISPVLGSKEQEFRERKSSTSSFNKTQGVITGEKSMEFIPPSNSVKKGEWVKDEKVSSCMNCHQAFSMVSTGG